MTSLFTTSRVLAGILGGALLLGPALAEGLPRAPRAPAPPGMGHATSRLVLPVVGPVEEAAAVLGNRAPADLPAGSYLKATRDGQAAYEVYDRQGKLLGTLQGRQASGPLRFQPAGR